MTAPDPATRRPILLPANQPPDRFYRGGSRIDAFRGGPPSGAHSPEDWIASVTVVAGRGELGCSALPDGRLLRDAVRADPLAWLGAAHLARFGADTRLLVKLLDAGERLPVHAHPDAAFAHRHLGRLHGKAEAWYVLEPGEVHVGLRRDVAPEELAELVRAQDAGALLGLLHRIRVERGQIVYVPPGVLHAIGEGVFILEVQEPEDLSILAEWRGFALDGAAEGHLGLGFDLALRAVDARGLSEGEATRLVGETLPAEAGAFFRLERLEGEFDVRGEAGLAVVVVVEGETSIEPEAGEPARAGRGSTVLLAHALGRVRMRGSGLTLVARPPAPV